jgi:hypothetical protein
MIRQTSDASSTHACRGAGTVCRGWHRCSRRLHQHRADISIPAHLDHQVHPHWGACADNHDDGIAAGWPGLGNTGRPAGTILTQRSTNIVLSRNVEVLDSVSLTSRIDLTATTVTVKSCRIRGLLGCCAGITVDGGNNLLVDATEVDGLGKDGKAFGVTRHSARWKLHVPALQRPPSGRQ